MDNALLPLLSKGGFLSQESGDEVEGSGNDDLHWEKVKKEIERALGKKNQRTIRLEEMRGERKQGMDLEDEKRHISSPPGKTGLIGCHVSKTAA